MDGITPPKPKHTKPVKHFVKPAVVNNGSQPVINKKAQYQNSQKNKSFSLKFKPPKKAQKLILKAQIFYKKHQLPIRITAGAMAVLMIVTLGVEILNFVQNNKQYELSSEAKSLLGNTNKLYAQKLSYDSVNQKYVYNPNYQPQTQDVAGQISGPKFSASFAANADKSVEIKDPVNSVSLSYVPKFNTADPIQSENRLIYPLKGKDGAKVYTLRAGSVKEDIVLEKFTQKTLEFSYELKLADNTEARLENDGSIGVYGPSQLLLSNITTATETDQQLLQKARDSANKNQLLFTIPKPFIIDSNKKQGEFKARYSLENNILTIHAENLDKARYPLTIDPTVYIETAAKLMRGNNETNIDFDIDNELIQKSQTTGARIDSWSSANNLSNPTWGQGTAVAGGYIYSVAGGGGDSVVTTTYYTAGTDTFTVPTGVTSLTVKTWGGGGGGGSGNGNAAGGNGGGGGYAKAVITTTPGENLNITVGSGGAAGTTNSTAGDGGGYSSVDRSGTYLVQAGAGGGGGATRGSRAGGRGGAGGGASGIAGSTATGAGGGGGAGTAAAGGAGGTASTGGAAGTAGAANAGGNAPSIATSCATAQAGTGSAGGFGAGGNGGNYTGAVCSNGGGGGSGRFGGGGGGSTNSNNRGGGGGGGGSSLVTGTSTVQTAGSGTTPGNDADADRNGAGQGGSGNASGSGATAGAAGAVVLSYTISSATTTTAVSWAKFDNTTKEIVSPNPGAGVCSGWCTNSAYDLPVALKGLSLVAYNGYLYAIGGSNSSDTPQTSVYIAKIGANGEPQLWHPSGGTPVYWYSDTALSNARSYFGAVAYNNRMYILGGLTTSSTVLSSNTVQVANINPIGTLGTWSTTGMSALTSNRYGLSAQVYNNVIYVIGGNATFTGTPINTVEYVKLNSDGSMNSWVTTSSIATSGRQTMGGSFSTIFGGYIYIGGGCTAVNASGYCTTIATDVQLASINADGSLAEWNTILNLDNTRIGHTLIAWQGGLYRLGGCRAQNTTTGACTDTVLDVDYGVINPDGEASTVANSVPSGTTPCSGGNPYSCDLPSASVGNMLNASVIANGYLYIMGGCTNNACTTYSNGITYQAVGSDGTLRRPASCSGTFTNSYCINSVNLPSARAATGVAVFNSRIYLVGGFPTITNISYASVNPDGSIGTWSNTDTTSIGATDVSYSFAYARANPNSAGSNPGNLYIFGGCSGTISGIGCSGYSQSVYKCNINTSGVPSGCTTTGQTQIGTVTGASGTGLGAHAGAVYANYIYLMGGLAPGITDLTTVRYAKFDDNNNVVESDGAGTAAWTESPSEILVGRRRGAGFGYNGFLYVTGGYDGTDALADIEFAKINVSDGSIGAWRASSVSINKRWGLTVPVSNSYAYVIGGCIAGPAPSGCTSRTNSIQTFQVYNNDSGVLQSVTNFSDDTFANAATENRWGASAAVLNGYIYVAGGCISATDCTDATNDVQYAPISATNGSIGTWATATNVLPFDRAWGQLEVAGGNLYYIGGQDDTATNEQSAIYYVGSFSSGNISAAWSTASGGIGDTASQAAQARTKFSATVWNNRIYVIGGLDGSGAVSNTVYVSPELNSGGNIAADSWISDADVPDVARYGAALTAYANNLYLFGGNDGTNYLNDAQFTPLGYRTGTITQSGTTITGSGTSWASTMVGSYLQYEDGSRTLITGFTSTTSITVDVSRTIASAQSYIIQDGSIGAWTFTTSTPGYVSEADAFAANGYVYLVGGRSATSTCSPQTLIAPISANTVIDPSDGIANDNLPTGVGEWSETNVRYAGGRYGVALAYDAGKMYTMGGGCTSPQNSTYTTGTIQQTGVAVTGAGTNWTDNYIGGTITYADASTAKIVSVNSTTSITVDTTKTVTAGSTYTITVPRHQYAVLKSQPQVAYYSRMIDTDTDVFPTKWLMNGIDNSIGARWQMKYRSMHDINTTSDTVGGTLQQNPNEDCGTSATMPAMTTWGQETSVGDVTLGTPGTYTPKEASGGNINCARYFYFYITIDASKTFGYPEDVQRGPTISDLSLFFTADPSKRMRHGKTFTGGEQQPLDTPF